MYFKLALKNIRRSFKDYAIYFLTLIFGVCVFYVFNSIGDQSILMDMSEMHQKMFEMVSKVLGVASVFIAFILGFLIVYANRYLIKRRKKEFGIYMTLGMETNKLSSMVFIETMIVGIFSLMIGLILGIIASQFLSIITAKLFKVNLTQFKFIFSKDAFIKTIICFGIIYLIVLLFNSVVIRKVKLINLLMASKKNEKIKVRSLKISVLIFILSIVFTGTGYYVILKYGMALMDEKVLFAIICGCIGTFLFFFSLTGFLLKVVQSNKNFYFKNLNMFILRQINSKINTAFISMTFICLMLFVAICTFSGGMGISTAMNDDMESLTQFDVCIYDVKGGDVNNSLKDKGIKVEDYAESFGQINMYDIPVKYSEVLTEAGKEAGKSYYPIMDNQNMGAVKLSEFNKLMEVLGKEKIDLNKDEYAIFYDVDDFKPSIEEIVDKDTKITIDNKVLKPSNRKAINATVYNSMMKMNLGMFVFNDEVLKDVEPVQCYLNLNYNEKGTELLDKLEDIKGKENTLRFMDREIIITQSVGIGAMASYLAIYLGIIFLITSSAVLALQQLSEADDNRERYGLLRKLGVEEGMINKSILIQILIYFMIPLSLAIVHSIVGLKVSSEVVVLFGNGNMIKNSIITAVLLVIVYGGYFIATYLGSKKMAQ